MVVTLASAVYVHKCEKPVFLSVKHFSCPFPQEVIPALLECLLPVSVMFTNMALIYLSLQPEKMKHSFVSHSFLPTPSFHAQFSSTAGFFLTPRFQNPFHGELLQESMYFQYITKRSKSNCLHYFMLCYIHYCYFTARYYANYTETIKAN